MACAHAARFGGRYRNLRLASLKGFAQLLQQHPEAGAFIEFKGASLERFSPQQIVTAALSALAPVLEQCVLISSSAPLLLVADTLFAGPKGTILTEYCAETLAQACQLAPEYCFVRHDRIPVTQAKLPPMDFQWVVYSLDRADQILRQLRAGAQLVETDCVSRELLAAVNARLTRP